MTTFKVYYGAAKPMVAVGKHQCRLLEFAEKYKGWHTFAPCPATVRAIKALEAKGYIECNGDQFRFTYPKG